MEIRNSFLVESALLTHGLPSISNEMLLAQWPEEIRCIAWVDHGELITGGMDEFVRFRERAYELIRIDCYTLDEAISRKYSGALTASGTMELASRCGIPLAVSCGIGGIGDIRGEELCPDLPALETIPTALLATSPKDMLDIRATINWLRDHGVTVTGTEVPVCNGYQFCLEDVVLDGTMTEEWLPAPKNLLLNPIPESERLTEIRWLSEGIEAGKRAEAEGKYYHPAVNAELDRLSGGRAAAIQLASIVRNAVLARKICS